MSCPVKNDKNRKCGADEYCLGLCKRHYFQAWRLKKKSPQEYAVLVKSGVIRPKGHDLARMAEQAAASSG